MHAHTKLLQSCPTLCDPMDCSPPGSSVHGFSRQEYWSGLPCPLQVIILTQESNPGLLCLLIGRGVLYHQCLRGSPCMHILLIYSILSIRAFRILAIVVLNSWADNSNILLYLVLMLLNFKLCFCLLACFVIFFFLLIEGHDIPGKRTRCKRTLIMWW